MRGRAWILGAFASAALLSCGSSSQSPSKPVDPAAGTFHVRDGFVRDPQGRTVILRGVNLAGAHKSPPYFGFHQPDDYVRVSRDWGMNALRFLVVWAAIEPQKGVYDDAYLDAVAQRMDWARDAGLLVVLDMHQDVYGEGFGVGDGAPKWTCDASHYASFVPANPWFLDYASFDVFSCYQGFWNSDDLQRHYAAAWRAVAKRLAAYDDVVVGFDMMNEPFCAFEAAQLQPLYERVVREVRAEAPRWVAFTEPASSRNLGGHTELAHLAYDGVVYAPHSYDRDAESGNGFDPSHRDALLANVKALADEARGLGAALWIGEYGGSADSPGIAAYMTAQYDAAGAVAAGSMYWDYEKGGGYGLLDANGAEQHALTDVITRPFPERVAGDPIAWSFDATTSTFTMSWHPDAHVTAPTIVSVPARVYPNGYDVACGGCASDRAGGELVVKSAPPGDPAVLTVKPAGAP